jgi:Ni,Fe-hydrogenase III large subunit
MAVRTVAGDPFRQFDLFRKRQDFEQFLDALMGIPEPRLKKEDLLSGDSSYSHSLAFCLALESLSGTRTGETTGWLRVIFCELERLANHLGDIGAIMTDTGFNFGGAHGARLREMVMQMNERLTGSRFLRGVNTIGGVIAKAITSEIAACLDAELEGLRKDFSEVMDVALESNSLLNRLKNTGVLDARTARDHGVIGVAGKAVGFFADARVDYPYAAYDKLPFEVATEHGGDVYARFAVRVKEVDSSIGLIQRALRNLPPQGDVNMPCAHDLKKNAYAVGIVEGWRGDIVTLIATDAHGDISRVSVRDPSFLNWTALGYAAVGNVVPDFPLINKSFNLSYSGNDL